MGRRAMAKGEWTSEIPPKNVLVLILQSMDGVATNWSSPDRFLDEGFHVRELMEIEIEISELEIKRKPDVKVNNCQNYKILRRTENGTCSLKKSQKVYLTLIVAHFGRELFGYRSLFFDSNQVLCRIHKNRNESYLDLSVNCTPMLLSIFLNRLFVLLNPINQIDGYDELFFGFRRLAKVSISS
jgi:hypothetical protein